MKTKKDVKYAYPLKLDGNLKTPLQNLATSNRRNINDEINIAVERYLNDVVKDFKPSKR